MESFLVTHEWDKHIQESDQPFPRLEELERSSGVASGQMKTTKYMIFCDIPIFAFSRRACYFHKTPRFNIEPGTSFRIPTIECSLFFARKQVPFGRELHETVPIFSWKSIRISSILYLGAG